MSALLLGQKVIKSSSPDVIKRTVKCSTGHTRPALGIGGKLHFVIQGKKVHILRSQSLYLFPEITNTDKRGAGSSLNTGRQKPQKRDKHKHHAIS